MSDAAKNVASQVVDKVPETVVTAEPATAEAPAVSATEKIQAAESATATEKNASVTEETAPVAAPVEEVAVPAASKTAKEQPVEAKTEVEAAPDAKEETPAAPIAIEETVVSIAVETPTAENFKEAPTPAADATPSAPTEVAADPVAETPAADVPANEAPTAAPAASVKSAETVQTPLEKLTALLPSIIEEATYAEMWGIDLKIASVPATIVLQKFLRAKGNNVDLAKEQLIKALKWRRDVNPIHQLESKQFEQKFANLGFVTLHKKEGQTNETVIAWNIYGAVKNKKETFGNVEEFIAWRSAFMELSVHKLKIDQATEVLKDGEEDPYQMIQVHDYKGVSFFRADSETKAATKETINVLSTAYPELMSHKFFVNVPAIMGFMFSIVKRFVDPVTVRKFHPMYSGSSLASELKGLDVPQEYGGSGPSVMQGEQVKLITPDTPVESTAEIATTEVIATEAPAEKPDTDKS